MECKVGGSRGDRVQGGEECYKHKKQVETETEQKQTVQTSIKTVTTLDS